MGDAAANLERQALTNTVKDIMRLVGITESQWEEERHWWNMPLRFENRQPIVTLDVDGAEQDFRPDQLLAMLLTKFSNDCKLSMNSFQLCLTHPVYFDQEQKTVLSNAAKIAGIDCVKITPEITALSYQ